MEMFWLYMFTRLDAILVTSLTVLIVSGCAFCVAGFVWAMEGFDDEFSGPKLLTQRGGKAMVIAGVVLMLTPSQKDVAVMLAGSAVLHAARTPEAGRIASKSVQLIEQTLDAYLKPKSE